MRFNYVKAAALLSALAGGLVPALAEEPPPTTRDPAVAAALGEITPAVVARYIEDLQNFKTRYSYMEGCERARDYLFHTFAAWGYQVQLKEFKGTRLLKGYWGDARGTAWVSTAGSTFFRSSDGGASWHRQVTSAPMHVYDACFVDASVGYVVSGESTVAKTEDGGWTWTNACVERSGSGVLRAVFFITRDVGWVAGTHGGSPRIYRTDDGGGRWVGQSLPDFGCPHTIVFGNVDEGWAIPNRYEDSVVYRTENGGAKWVVQDIPVPPADVKSFQALSGRVAWAAHGGPTLLHTEDGGASWSLVEPSPGAVLTAVSFVDAYRGYAAGREVLFKTEDGGRTWSKITAAPKVFWGDVAFGDAQTGLLIDLFGKELYFTGDGGGSFQNVSDRLDMYWETIVAEKRGSEADDEIVLLGAHYDSYSDRPTAGAPGADANASGVSCVLAAAAAFRTLPIGRTLRFALFGGAEQGYLGSRAYVAEARAKDEKIIAAVLPDMVAYDEDRGARDDAIIKLDGPSMWLADYVATVAELYGNPLMFDYQMNAAPGDHCAFWEGKYEAVGLFEGGLGPKPELVYPYYHTSEDTLDKLDVPLGTEVARAAAGAVAHLARSEYVGIADPPGAAREKPRTSGPFFVFPNPYRLGDARGVTFEGISSPAVVAIFDLAGRKVVSSEVGAGTDSFRWSPRGARDAGLAPGVYVYRVWGNGQRESGKLVFLGR